MVGLTFTQRFRNRLRASEGMRCPSSIFVRSRRLSAIFSHRANLSSDRSSYHTDTTHVDGLGDGHVLQDGPARAQLRMDDISSTSSSQSSMLSLWEPAWRGFPVDYDEAMNYNTLDAESGRRLQALQTSMSNPDLSALVRVLLQSAYRQFEKQSARSLEILPRYSQDCRPPPYLAS